LQVLQAADVFARMDVDELLDLRMCCGGRKIMIMPPAVFHWPLRPTDGQLPKARCTYGEDDIQFALVFYSNFEQLDVPCSGPMDKLDVQKYYEPNTYPLRGPSLQCAWSRAVDALVPPRQCYTNDPIQAPKVSA
jgi:hypothetical protein